MKPFHLEQLPDETILNVVSHLSLWDAFAMETTNKRMHGVVRAHQKVQEKVDISFPMHLVPEEIRNERKKSIENMHLTRFGPKLRKIDTNGYSFCMELFDNEHFIEKLAHACPNLIELPTYHVPALFMYASGHLATLKKIEMGSRNFTANQVKNLLANCTQLEDLDIRSDYSERNWDVKLLEAIEAYMPAENKIRKLKCHLYNSKFSLYQVIERLIKKLPHLEHFNISVHEIRCHDEHNWPLTHMLATTKCKISLQFINLVSIQLALSYAPHMTSIKIRFYTINVIKVELCKFPYLKQLEISFATVYNQFNRPFINYPPSLRELNIGSLSLSAEVTFIEECIRNQGKQFERVSFNYLEYCKPAHSTVGNILLWTNRLLRALSESSTMLKSLNISEVESLPGFDSELLRSFLKTFGGSLEEFHADNQLLSLSTLELIKAECKALKSLKFSFVTKDREDNLQMIKMKELLKGMTNLYEAEVKVIYHDVLRGEWVTVAQCAYANYKFVLRRIEFTHD